MECDSLYHLSKNHSSLTSSSDISSLHISAATETSIRLNLHRLGSTFKSVDEIEHTLNDLEKWKDSVPQVEVYKRYAHHVMKIECVQRATWHARSACIKESMTPIHVVGDIGLASRSNIVIKPIIPKYRRFY